MTPEPGANKRTCAPPNTAGAAQLPPTGAKGEYRSCVHRASDFLKEQLEICGLVEYLLVFKHWQYIKKKSFKIPCGDQIKHSCRPGIELSKVFQQPQPGGSALYPRSPRRLCQKSLNGLTPFLSSSQHTPPACQLLLQTGSGIPLRLI